MQKDKRIGKIYGYLTVIKPTKKCSDGHMQYLCKCKCGKTKIIRSNNLNNGGKIGCGCLRIKHGHCKNNGMSSVYGIWASMIQRCKNKNNNQYNYYGGRGIKVCQRWLKFENFLKDMGEKPKEKSLDRINNNGNYCKKNCRWATIEQQVSNKRNNKLFTFHNRTQCVSFWAREYGIHLQTFWRRIKLNWSIEKILNTPIREIKK